MGEGKSEVLQGTHYQARGMNAEDAARIAHQGYDRPSRGTRWIVWSQVSGG